MAPINLPDGTEVSEVILPDGATASEVVAPDGSTVFSGIPDSRVFDFETGDVSRWDSVNDLSADTAKAFNGSFSGLCDSAQSGTFQAKVIPSGYSGGLQPNKFEYYWNEDSANFGSGVRLLNSNGNVEVGTATNSPQWVIDDNNGVNEVFGGDGTDRWIRYTLTFDWGVGTFSADFKDLTSGSTFSDSGRSLKNGVNIETIQIDDFNGTTWQDGGGINTHFDDIGLFG